MLPSPSLVLRFKVRRLSLLMAGALFCGACHNNAHLRTQRMLEPGEKVYSGSGVVAVGGETYYGVFEESGVSGMRGELSLLSGRKSGEAGPYLGLGYLQAESFDFIAGYEYRRYMHTDKPIPWKLGLQAEVNFAPGSEFGFKGGTTLHLRPSYTSTISSSRPLYGGLHGILALGSLETRYGRMEWTGEYYEWGGKIYEWPEEDVRYQFTSVGAGLTAGLEFPLRNMSLQLQVDASLLQNTYASDEYTSEWGEEPSQVTFLVAGSAGINFFRPPPSPKIPSEPYPVPLYGGDAQDAPEIQFDPETGERLEPKEEVEFDPETGLPIRKQTPGEVVQPEIGFDPETGEMMSGEPAKPGGSRDYLGGLKAKLILKDGRSMEVKLTSIDSYTVLHSRMVSQVNALGEQRKVPVTRETPLDSISSIQVPGKKVGIVGAILGGACVLGCGVPILLAIVTESGEVGAVALVATPIGLLAGAFAGYNKTKKEVHNLSQMTREEKRFVIIRLSKKQL